MFLINSAALCFNAILFGLCLRQDGPKSNGSGIALGSTRNVFGGVFKLVRRDPYAAHANEREGSAVGACVGFGVVQRTVAFGARTGWRTVAFGARRTGESLEQRALLAEGDGNAAGAR